MKFLKSTIFNLFACLLASLVCSDVMQSQSNPNSVYSRFGLGLLDSPGAAPHFGMGGTTTAITDPIVLNLANPASYSFLDVTNLQIMGKGGYTKASNSITSSSYGSGQFHELGMGFKKPGSKWGLAFGITPFSSIDYKFTSQDTLSDTLKASYTYEGNGGLNKVTIGTSRLFKFYRKPNQTDSLQKGITDTTNIRVHQLSIGINANYVFGNVRRENRIVFDNSETYTTLNNVTLWAQGFIFEAGLLYKVNLTSKRDDKDRIVGGSNLQLGADYMLNGNLFADYSELISSIRILSNGAIRDTSFHLESEKGRLIIPQRISVGAVWKLFGKKWGSLSFAFDYKLQDWSQYKLRITNEANLDKGLNSSNTMSAGVEFKPATDVNNGFFNRMNYRVGYRSYESALVLNNTRIIQQGVTMGLSIPVIRSLSKFHIGAELGKTGTTDAGLVEERYLTIMAGVTLTPSAFDKWFRQIKYD
jgi:hypothetical protein